jgi:hypothetical protein
MTNLAEIQQSAQNHFNFDANTPPSHQGFDGNGFDGNGFDNYDEHTYNMDVNQLMTLDPNGYTEPHDYRGKIYKRNKRRAKTGQYTLTVVSTATTVNLKIQLLCPDTNKVELTNGQKNAKYSGTYAFNSNGDLVISFTDTTTKTITISCAELPFQELLSRFKKESYVLQGLKIKTTNSSNFANAVGLGYWESGGMNVRDTLIPQNYVSPKDFQTGLVDVPLAMVGNKSVLKIDYRTEWDYVVNAGDTLVLSVFVGNYTRNILG